jgi:hypothetical protein
MLPLDPPIPRPDPPDHSAQEHRRKLEAELLAAALVLLDRVVRCTQRLPVGVAVARDYLVRVGERVK